MRYLSCFAVIALVAAGCGPEASPDTGNAQLAVEDSEFGSFEDEEMVEAKEVWPGQRQYDAPHASTPPASGDPRALVHDARSALVEQLTKVSADRAVVLRGEVLALTASERTLPAGATPIAFGAPPIVTAATVSVAETLCGDELSGTVAVSYVGGTLPGKRAQWNSVMPRGLTEGRTYVIVAEQIDGEYFITWGERGVLRLDDGDSTQVRDYRNGLLSVSEIGGVCP